MPDTTSNFLWRIGSALLALTLSFALASTCEARDRTVIVVLFDGFAPAMLDGAKAPNFAKLKAEGAWSEHLVPAFPTVSMINHTTFVTGCWPARHGIMSNNFIDPVRGLYVTDEDADWLEDCEPIWVAAERQGVRSAALNFDRRHSTRRGQMATFITPPAPWKDRASDEDVINSALDLLKSDAPEHPRLISLYFERPDSIAHYNGVKNPKTAEAVAYCDEIIGRLMAGIQALPADREASLIIGTDHGMIDVGPMVNMGRIMVQQSIKGREATDGASAFIYLDPGENIDRVMNALKAYDYALTAYRKGSYPAYAHLGTSPRAGDILLLARPPYWMVGPEVLPDWGKWVGVNLFWPAIFKPFGMGLKASHGYAPDQVEMHGIFYAWGAGIGRGVEIPKIDMVDIHPTIMGLLGLKPGEPMDGKAVPLITAP
jgi:predicted AlkP superfamily pyrophosphatase or phosphodiesterase